MNTQVDIQHENAYENPEVGSVWTNGEDVGILAVVDSEEVVKDAYSLAAYSKPLYAVITLESERPNRFNDPTPSKKEAVDGLDPFHGKVTLTQE